MPQFTEKWLVRHEGGLFEGDYSEYESYEEGLTAMHALVEEFRSKHPGYGQYNIALVRLMEVVEAQSMGTINDCSNEYGPHSRYGCGDCYERH